jgi:serine/threonine protein kinase
MIGKQIEKYTIISYLGEGGMASVYMANDNKFDTNVAIKVLNKEYVHNDNIRKRFIAEARNMFKMSHPNIIKVNDLIDDGDTVAFVMEYIEGETLKEYIERKGKLSDEEIKNLFSQMLEAVGYVHEQNLVHRDIKPSNFMITPKGQIRLLDFGIAKTTDVTSAEYTQTGTGVQMGTPMYMSPEQVKSSKEVSHITDIYSLGVVLWQMVMGKKPYDTNELSLPEIQVNIIKENLPSTSTIFDDIIQKATQKHPEQRFQNIQAFQDAIKHPTKNTNLEQTIVNQKKIDEEETVVVQSNKRANSAKSSEISPASKKESISTHIPPNQEKKNNTKKWFYIGIGVILVSVLLFLFKEKPEEEVVDGEGTLVVEEVPLNETNDFGYKIKTFSDANIRAVKIPDKDYYVSETEVTRAQFEAFVSATGYQTTAEKEGRSWVLKNADKSYEKEGVNWRYNVSGTGQQPKNHPVIHVSWYDAAAFAKWVGGRLPLAEEWEYAAKGGQNFKYAGSNNIDEVAWYWENSEGETHLVKGKKANGYGLYDMTGNVYELLANADELTRACRGGSFFDTPWYCSRAYYSYPSPDWHDYSIGFRVLFP